MKRAALVSVAGLPGFCVSLVLLALLGCATQKPGEKGDLLPCTVVNLKGRARCSTNQSGSWQEMKSGQLLRPGDRVQTAADSYLDIASGTRRVKPIATGTKLKAGDFHARIPAICLRLYENTVVDVLELSRQPNQPYGDFPKQVRLNLRYGKMFVSIKEATPAMDCAIGLTNITIRLQSGRCFVSDAGIVSVVAGSALVSGRATNEATAVPSGFDFDASTGILHRRPSDQ